MTRPPSCGRRIQDNPGPRTESPSTRRTRPLPADWPARVAAVLERDGECMWMEDDQPCGSRDRLEVDHTGAADDHRLEVLRALCHWHHARWTAKQARAARGELPSRMRPVGVHPGLIVNDDGEQRDAHGTPTRRQEQRTAGHGDGERGVGGDPDRPPF